MKKTPKIKTESQCIDCGKTATASSVYKKNIHYMCDQCDCFFILDKKSRELRYYSLYIMQTQDTHIVLRSGATGDARGDNFVGPYCGVVYETRIDENFCQRYTGSFKLLANKFLMPAELREKEKLLRCFQ